MGSRINNLFEFGFLIGYFISLFTSVGPIQIFGVKLYARLGFPEDTEMNQTYNSAYLRGAFRSVGFITVCDFIPLCNKIIEQITSECCEV